MNFETLLEETIEKAISKSLPANLGTIEDLVLARFDERIIGVETAAELLGKHPDTIRAYAKFGQIKTEPRATDRSPFKFRLSTILKLRKEDLK